jgi:MoaA/NifB/PqqE/SkfB family radical SAM enzyme
MSLETYKYVLGKLGPQVQQVALGIGDIEANPDLRAILLYTRSQGIIPNITVNGNVSQEWVDRLASLCGAVAVSRYNKHKCYDTVARLCWASGRRHATLRQVNIHQILSLETLEECWQVLHDMQHKSRLESLNAVVFLLLKPKGRGTQIQQLRDMKRYRDLIDYALDKKLKIGFDSCGCSAFLKAVKDRPEFETLKTVAEPCESTRMSIYIDVKGRVFPCSFCEGTEKPLYLLKSDNFLEEIWKGEQFRNFRIRLQESKDELGSERCPVYNLEME